MFTSRVVAAPVAGSEKHERLASDVVYQGMTIAAMVLLLASLWAF